MNNIPVISRYTYRPQLVPLQGTANDSEEVPELSESWDCTEYLAVLEFAPKDKTFLERCQLSLICIWNRRRVRDASIDCAPKLGRSLVRTYCVVRWRCSQSPDEPKRTNTLGHSTVNTKPNWLSA